MASGLAASVAAAGVAAGPAGAASSGKVYACYSDTTKALYHTTSSSCKAGFTSISWNKQGPQGAQGARGSQGSQGAPNGTQGAQGAQGAAGALTAGFTNVNKSGKAVVLAKNTPTVVASFTPSVAGSYALDAAATVGPKGSPEPGTECYDATFSAATQPQAVFLPHTGTGFVWTMPISTNGILKGGPSKPVAELCEAISGSANAEHAQITGIQLSAAHTAATPAAAPRNSFVVPRKLGRLATPRSRRQGGGSHR